MSETDWRKIAESYMTLFYEKEVQHGSTVEMIEKLMGELDERGHTVDNLRKHIVVLTSSLNVADNALEVLSSPNRLSKSENDEWAEFGARIRYATEKLQQLRSPVSSESSQ